MAQKLSDLLSVSTVGVKAPGLTKFPEGGATFSADVTAGGAAVVQLRAGVRPGGPKEVLATFVLPCTQTGKVGDLFDSLPVFSIWDTFDWNVVSVTGTLALSAVGVGV